MAQEPRGNLVDAGIHPVSACQRLFNKVARHLLKQGERSVLVANGGLDTCQYRSAEGRMCAVGCLISDRYYKPDMEGWDIQGLLDHGYKLPKSITENVGFLSDLQQIHDGWDPARWLEKLREFAAERDLKTDALS